MQFPRMAREGEHFYREEKEIGMAVVNKESMAFHWLGPCQERSPSSFCWALLSSHMVRTPLSSLPALFN